ncbi:MAG: DUF4215 domain-containing protein [Sandaracinaceae bacterium]|nr:DUF4215 domain-containing protein [Sandaracinaceae bacterium]
MQSESPVCLRAELCGNGVLQSGETCDDGNATSGDGCSDVCAIEPGFSCVGTPSDCDEVCAAGGGSVSHFDDSRYEFCALGTADWAHAEDLIHQDSPAVRLVRINSALEQRHVRRGWARHRRTAGVLCEQLGVAGRRWPGVLQHGTSSSERYNHWRNGGPSGGDCARLRPAVSSVGMLNHDGNRAFICERALEHRHVWRRHRV